MRADNLNIEIRGGVKPPADLLDAARKTLGDQLGAFLDRYGDAFTARELVEFTEKMTWR